MLHYRKAHTIVRCTEDDGGGLQRDQSPLRICIYSPVGCLCRRYRLEPGPTPYLLPYKATITRPQHQEAFTCLCNLQREPARGLLLRGLSDNGLPTRGSSENVLPVRSLPVRGLPTSMRRTVVDDPEPYLSAESSLCLCIRVPEQCELGTQAGRRIKQGISTSACY